jgi:hypothetical protein
MTVLRRLLRGAVGAVLVLAAAGKLLDERGTRLAPILLGAGPGGAGVAAAVVEDALPWLELLAGLATWLAAGRWARSAIVVALGGALVWVSAAMPAGVRCGCFGMLWELESRAGHVALASCVALSGCALCWLERRRPVPSH